MHVVKGVFCKTAKPGIIAKFVEPKKIDTGPDLLAQQQEKSGGAPGVSHHGPSPVGEERGWQGRH